MAEQLQGAVADEGSSRLAWFLTGAVIGGVAAMLYAPGSGRATRKRLTDAAQKSRDAMSDQGAHIADAGKEMFERGRQLVDEAADLFERGRKLVQG